MANPYEDFDYRARALTPEQFDAYLAGELVARGEGEAEARKALQRYLRERLEKPDATRK